MTCFASGECVNVIFDLDTDYFMNSQELIPATLQAVLEPLSISEGIIEIGDDDA